MAIVISGKTLCKICGKVLKHGDSIVGFPAYFGDEADPFYFFNDSGFHKECFLKHPQQDSVLKRMDELAKIKR